jgi:hypothetical protein
MTVGSLTERQRVLLLTAVRHGRVATEFFGGRGPQGGRVSGGLRETNAACRPRDMGLLERVDGDHTMLPERGNTVHIYSSRWRITPEGRALIET